MLYYDIVFGKQTCLWIFSFAALLLFIAEAATIEFTFSSCYFLNKNIHSIVFFISVISKISTIVFIHSSS